MPGAGRTQASTEQLIGDLGAGERATQRLRDTLGERLAQPLADPPQRDSHGPAAKPAAQARAQRAAGLSGRRRRQQLEWKRGSEL